MLVRVTVGFGNQDIPAHTGLSSLRSGKPAGFLSDLVSATSSSGLGLPDSLIPHLLSQWVVTDGINVPRELFLRCGTKSLFLFKLCFLALLLVPDCRSMVTGHTGRPDHSHLELFLLKACTNWNRSPETSWRSPVSDTILWLADSFGKTNKKEVFVNSLSSLSFRHKTSV